MNLQFQQNRCGVLVFARCFCVFWWTDRHLVPLQHPFGEANQVCQIVFMEVDVRKDI